MNLNCQFLNHLQKGKYLMKKELEYVYTRGCRNDKNSLVGQTLNWIKLKIAMTDWLNITSISNNSTMIFIVYK